MLTILIMMMRLVVRETKMMMRGMGMETKMMMVVVMETMMMRAMVIETRMMMLGMGRLALSGQRSIETDGCCSQGCIALH